jgi:hypothetical protein
MRTVFIKENGNFEKSQELKGRTKKFKNLYLFIARVYSRLMPYSLSSPTFS